MMHHCCIQWYFPWWITMMQNRITPLPQGELVQMWKTNGSQENKAAFMVDFFTWVGHVSRRVTMNHQRFKATLVTLGLQMALSILWQRSIAWHRWCFCRKSPTSILWPIKASMMSSQLKIHHIYIYIKCLFIDYRWSVIKSGDCKHCHVWLPLDIQMSLVDLLWPRKLCTWQLCFLRSRRIGAREHFTNGSLEVKIAATGTVSASELQLGRWQVCKWFK